MKIFDDYLQLLEEFVAFPSVSTDSAYLPAIKQTAEWLARLLESHGFTVETWNSSELNPVVCGRYTVSDDAPTTLVYGHYDVQPAAQADGWQSDPFKLDRRDGRLYGRGVVDNKGQVLIHLATAFALITSGQLAHNLIFLIEGNEETGSAGLSELLKQHREQLACDQILISDGEIPYRPTIEAALRGSFNVRIRYRTAPSSLHSGLYGGGIPNAAQELSQLLAGLYDSHHKVAVAGFYNDVDPITANQRAATQALYVGETRLKEVTGIQAAHPTGGYDYPIATSLVPSLEISGVASGYTGDGFANVIPAEAEARVNVRIVASQSPAKVYQALAMHIQAHTPDYVDCELEMDMPCDPIKLQTDSPLVRSTQKLLEQAFGQPALFSYCGASIPIVSDFKSILGRDSLLVSLGNDDCNMHGLDENFEIELLQKGLGFSRLFFSQPPKTS